MPGRAEKEHSAPRLCLVTAQWRSEGREQSLSLGLKIEFRHQEVTQMQLQKGRSCKEKQVTGRQRATAGYLLLLDPNVRVGWHWGKRKLFKELSSFTSSPVTESVSPIGDARSLRLGTQIATAVLPPLWLAKWACPVGTVICWEQPLTL